MKKVLFHDSYLLSGIMCFDGCGKSIKSSLQDCIKTCIKEKLLPEDAQLTVDAEPQGLGIHNYLVTIQSKKLDFKPSPDFTQQLTNKIKEHIYFELVTEEPEKPSATTVHWRNLLINLLAISIISLLATFISPSLFLTLGLTSFSFITTAFTARRYLLDFFRRLFNNESLFNMNTTISLGWFLSLAHSLFHAISMPVFSSASMVFMNWIMPVVLIACINGMDEIKRLLVEKAQKHHLKNLHTLFPQMATHYLCHELSDEQHRLLGHQVAFCLIDQAQLQDNEHAQATYAKRFSTISQLLPQTPVIKENKNTLSTGMLIQIEPNQCFPVDGIIIKGNTLVDSSLINGEPLQNKRLGQQVPAGAINLGKKVTVYALKSSYNSTVNTLLLRANRAQTIPTTTENRTAFWSLYTGLIVLSLLSALATPTLLGIATLPLLLQNVIGILFAICPCTIALAHQLPYLLNHYHLDRKGIHLRDESLQQKEYPIHTYVFDKTGTLTTNTSVVASSTIPKTSSLWQRIYLLEEAYGKEHPIAKALMNYYKKPEKNTNIVFEAVQEPEPDPQNRGLSAWVLGKKLHIGNAAYLKESGITIPDISQIDGLTCVHVAENGQYQGVIYVQHQLRQGIREALQQLKKENKKLIMLTGDHCNAAVALNKELGFVFAEHDIHAEQKPQDKETFLEHLMNSHPNPEGFCFVGDGLNDAPCCRMVSEKGGLSCSMEADDKSTFFTDISLNGSLQYLFHHNALNQKLEQSLFQNQGIMIYSILSSLVFTLSFSITGLAIPPLIPMTIMLATTLIVLFNAYRTPLSIDNLLDKKSTWPIRFFAANHSINLVLAATCLLITSLITATFISGTLTLPLITFQLGPLMAISSLCTLSALGLLGVVGAAITLHAWNYFNDNELKEIPQTDKEKPSLFNPNPVPSFESYPSLFTPYKKIPPTPKENPLLPLPACSPLDN